MSTKVLGSFAEYILLPERIARLNVFLKPDSLPFEIASLLEPLACVAQAILELKKKRLLPTENALVIGPGAIGLMFVAALQASGVDRVTLAGRNPSRLEVGQALGASTVRWPCPIPIPGFDLVIECTGQVEVWETSIDYARRGGTVILFGGCPSGTKVQFDTGRLHYDQISLESPFHFGAQAVRLAHRWLVEETFDLSPLITERRELEQGDSTFRDLIEGRGIKYVFTP
jgi:L-iditol 2-dehydrogenase